MKGKGFMKSEERFKSLVEMFPDAVLIFSANGEIQFTNQSALKLFGAVSSKDLEGLNSLDLTHPDYRDIVKQRRRDGLVRGKNLPRTELKYLRLDGSEFVGEGTLGHTTWNGRDALQGVIRDITERKQAEETLRLQALIARQMSEAVLVMDVDGRLVDWNPAAERMFGYSKEEMLGRTTDVLHDNAQVADTFAQVIAEGMVRDGYWNGDVNIIRKDGSTGICEISVMPLQTENGDIIGRVGVNRDVTVQRIAEQELARHHEHLEELVEEQTAELRMVTDNLPVLITRLDAEQRYIFVNKTAERWFNREANQILGRTVREVLGDAAHEKLAPPLEGIIAGRSTNFQNSVTYPDGVTREVEISYVSEFHPDGTVRGSFGLAVDISERKKAERELTESDRRFRSLIDNAPGSIYLKDRKGRFLIVNRRFMERINSSAEDIIGRTSDSLSFLPRTVVESYLEQERQVLETGEAMSTEQVWRHHNGEIGVNLSTKFPVRDAAGEISAVGTINIDISSQKQAERSLQKSEERFRDFSEAASDWVWEMDSDLRFSFLSPSLDRHIGQPRELSLGRSRADAYADIIGSGTSEEITSWQRHLEDLLSRRPFRNFEQRWVTPDGETRYFLNSGKPVFDASGNFAGYRGVGSNITERKQAEAMLRDIESRFRAFIDNSPSAILLKNIKGQYMLANQTWHNWFNPDGQEIVGKTVFDFYPPKHAEDVNEIDQYVIETGTVVQREIQTPFPDGIERTTIFQKFLILDSNGKVVGIGGLNTDITELRRAEE